MTLQVVATDYWGLLKLHSYKLLTGATPVVGLAPARWMAGETSLIVTHIIYNITPSNTTYQSGARRDRTCYLYKGTYTEQDLCVSDHLHLLL